MERVVQGITRRLRYVRHLPERMLHRRRRADAERRLREIGKIERLLVVCSGNICRSPYLAAVLRRELPSVRLASAGFVGFNRPVPDHSLNVAAMRGIDLSLFRSQTLEPRRARTADLVIVMEPRQARYLASYFGVPRRRILVAGDLDPITPQTRSIEDPYQQAVQAFEFSFDRLDRCAAALCSMLRSSESFETSTNPIARPSGRSGAAPERLPQPAL